MLREEAHERVARRHLEVAEVEAGGDRAAAEGVAVTAWNRGLPSPRGDDVLRALVARQIAT